MAYRGWTKAALAVGAMLDIATSESRSREIGDGAEGCCCMVVCGSGIDL